jgi:hypothetical protein
MFNVIRFIDPYWHPVVKLLTIASPIGGHGGWDPFYEPDIGKVDGGTLRKNSFARPCEIIFGRARIFPFHHRKSLAILHAPRRAQQVQMLGLGLFSLPMSGLRAARSGDDRL